MNLEENSSYFFLRMYMWINTEWKLWREILPLIFGTNWSTLTPTVTTAIYKIKPTINGKSYLSLLAPKFDCFPIVSLFIYLTQITIFLSSTSLPHHHFNQFSITSPFERNYFLVYNHSIMKSRGSFGFFIRMSMIIGSRI